MATDLLKTLTPAQLDELTDILDARRKERTVSGKKVDYDAMTLQERADVNKTIHPMTWKGPHEDYPRVLYGINEQKRLVSVTVEDIDHEDVIRGQYPFEWKYSAAEHGIETAPSHGDGIRPVDLTPVPGVSMPAGMPPAEFAQGVNEAKRRHAKAKAA